MVKNVHEVQGWCYAIHAGSHLYIYDGPKSGLNAAVEAIKNAHPGSRVRYHQVK